MTGDADPARRLATAVSDLLAGTARALGVDNAVRTDRECTVCGATFEADRVTCPACDSQVSRRRTVTPNARLYLLFAMVAAGIESVASVLTGAYPREGGEK